MYKKEIDFSKYSSIKIGPKTEVLVIEEGDKIPKDIFLIGGANNLLISDTPPPLAILGKDFSKIYIENDFLIVGASVKSGQLISFAKKEDIKGFEFISKLPGTIGGLLAMNAGVKEYEIFNILDSIEIEGKWIPKDEISYGYRYANLNGIVRRAKFKIEKGYNENLRKELLKLRENQPLEPSAGSLFKNPKGDYAGRLIDEVGLKGYRYGDMGWSDKHANFLVNLGKGTFEEAQYLINLAKDRVFDKFGITLEEEVKIL